jgi:Na+-driven multidrug efflux pump
MLLTSILIGFSNGVAPVFSYQFGARQYKELLRLMKLALISLGVFSLAAFAGSRLLAHPLIALFLPAGGHAADLTLNGFMIFSFSFLCVGFNMFTSGFFTAISDGRTSAIASFTRNLAGIVIFLTILPKFFGFNGVWLAVPAADLSALFLSAFLLYDQRNVFIDKRRQQLARLRQPVHVK